MGTRTPNMSIYIPATGEEVYSSAFAAGMDNIDSHDHSGAPYNGVQIGTNGIQDGAITPEKLSQQVLNSIEATTVNNTPLEAVSIPVDESSAVTISGRFVALGNSATESVGGDFMGVFHRPTGSSVAQVGVNIINRNTDAVGSPPPTIQLVADTMNEAISVRVVGESGKTFDWLLVYNVISRP